MENRTFFEEIKVAGNELVDQVKRLIHEGNVHRIIIKDEHGRTFVEIPVVVAAVGAVFAPILAAVGALAAMAAHFTIHVEKSAPDAASGGTASASTGSGPSSGTASSVTTTEPPGKRF